jgi:hypothetical protein
MLPSVPAAPVVRTAPSALPRPAAASSLCAPSAGCDANTENEPRTLPGKPITADTGRWSNAPSPGWSPGETAWLRYRGVEKNNAWLHNRTAALNLRRLLSLGLIRNQGTWALA